MVASELTAFLGQVDLASKRAVQRNTFQAVEHDYIELPQELIRSDGSLDVYPDVLKLFQPGYRNNRPVIRCSGWVGFIPLNDQFGIEVSTRVPVGNLERILSMALGYDEFKVLDEHKRSVDAVQDRPTSLVHILTDQFISSFEKVRSSGLVKHYERSTRVSGSPVGRVKPFETAWRSAKAGTPRAVSTAFVRTSNFGPNRVLRYTLERLFIQYSQNQIDPDGVRQRKIARAISFLSDIASASAAEVNPSAIARYIEELPAHHIEYAQLLLIAQLIIHDAGVSIRGSGGAAILPSILIDLAKAYEEYVRRLLFISFQEHSTVSVKDGNHGGPLGAMLKLFDGVLEGRKNPKVTPDIVIEVEGNVRIVIDAKHKPAPSIPDRDDVNQVVLYGARYNCKKVMLLHSQRPQGRPFVEKCGEVGEFTVFNGMINLAADPIDKEEQGFTDAIRALF